MESTLNKLYILLLIFIISLNLYSAELIRTKKIAKIGDEIILELDIKKYSKVYNISYDEAKNILIDLAILFTGAKLNIEEPSEEMINEQLRRDKAYYASIVGKEVREVTDEEFLASLNYHTYSLLSYKSDVKKNLWVRDYLNKKIEEAKLDPYTPTEKEINDLIKSKPDLFEEQEGVILSMIYFSFFKENGTLKNKQELDTLRKNSELCISELKQSEKYEDLVSKYSEDLISKNNAPKGRIGFIALDDPRVINSFSKEIVDDLKKSEKGIIIKVYETKNGLYIFKIDEKIKPQRLDKDETRIKAETYLINAYQRNQKENFKKQLINELKNVIDIIYY